MIETRPSVRDIALALYCADAIETGDSPTALETRNSSPTGVFWNVGQVVSSPEHKMTILNAFEDQIRQVMTVFRYRPDRIVGVPNGMNTWVSSLSDRLGIGQLVIKEVVTKEGLITYEIEGNYEPGMKTAVFEDVVTSGKSTREKAFDVLEAEGLIIPDFVGLIGRTAAGPKSLSKQGRRINMICNSIELGKILVDEGLMAVKHLDWIEDDYGPTR